MNKLRWLSLLFALIAAACGATLPPISVVFEPPAQPKNETPAEPPKVDTPPVTEPIGRVIDTRPFVNLNIFVKDAASKGIAGAECTVEGDKRIADGSGFINFAVRGSSDASCSAKGYLTKLAKNLPPGDQNVHLESDAPPVVAVPVPPVITNRSPDESSTADEWKTYFFKVLLPVHRMSPVCCVSMQAIQELQADLRSMGAEWQHTSDGTLRTRLYLPTGNPNDPFARPVDVGERGGFGGPWTWVVR